MIDDDNHCLSCELHMCTLIYSLHAAQNTYSTVVHVYSQAPRIDHVMCTLYLGLILL